MYQRVIYSGIHYGSATIAQRDDWILLWRYVESINSQPLAVNINRLAVPRSATNEGRMLEHATTAITIYYYRRAAYQGPFAAARRYIIE